MAGNLEISNHTDNFHTKITFSDTKLIQNLYGVHNSNIKIIENKTGVTANIRGNTIFLTGEDEEVALAKKILKNLYELLEEGKNLYPDDIDSAIRILSGPGAGNFKEIFKDHIYITSKKKIIAPRTLNQKIYMDSIRTHDMVFGIGPAGTGKTYLAMAMAISALTKKMVHRVILARPAVEAGEKLGFLPGDLSEKVNPYLRPLYDALYDMMDFDSASRLLEQEVIEVAPLAFMRGRTLNNAFVILDEAQNSTAEQMKMFLTRLGFDSKAVITGDITQIDLPNTATSGLIQARNILQNIKGIKFVNFSRDDVVRHPLVQEIIDAYDKYTKN